jgi:hypothetical protein
LKLIDGHKGNTVGSQQRIANAVGTIAAIHAVDSKKYGFRMMLFHLIWKFDQGKNITAGIIHI